MFCPSYTRGKKRKGLFCLIPSFETFNSHKLTSGNAAHMKTLQHLHVCTVKLQLSSKTKNIIEMDTSFRADSAMLRNK